MQIRRCRLNGLIGFSFCVVHTVVWIFRLSLLDFVDFYEVAFFLSDWKCWSLKRWRIVVIYFPRLDCMIFHRMYFNTRINRAYIFFSFLLFIAITLNDVRELILYIFIAWDREFGINEFIFVQEFHCALCKFVNM